MAEITVYGASFSPFVRKVLVLCAEKGLDLESVPISPRDIPAELRPHTPLGKIPFANVKGFWVADSSVICDYIERKYPAKPLRPDNDELRARVMFIEEYVDGGIIPNLGPKIVFPRVVNPLLLGIACDEAVVAEGIAMMPKYLDWLEAQLGGREFFVGDALTLADIAVASSLTTIDHARVGIEKWPNLLRHRAAMWARPSFAPWVAAERAWLASARK